MEVMKWSWRCIWLSDGSIYTLTSETGTLCYKINVGSLFTVLLRPRTTTPLSYMSVKLGRPPVFPSSQLQARLSYYIWTIWANGQLWCKAINKKIISVGHPKPLPVRLLRVYNTAWDLRDVRKVQHPAAMSCIVHSQSVSNLQLSQAFECWSNLGRLTFDQHVGQLTNFRWQWVTLTLTKFC